MANTLIRIQSTPGQTNLYVVLQRENSGTLQYWNTSGTPAWENYTSGNWASYDIALTESAPGTYYCTMPSTIAAGLYGVLVYQQAGGSPSYTADNPLPGGEVYWTGTNLIDPASLVVAGVALDMTQAVPSSNTAQTVGDALLAARTQGFGKWALSGTTLTLYAANGSTVVRTFTLNSASSPTSRT